MGLDELQDMQRAPAPGWHLLPIARHKNGKLRWVTCAPEDEAQVARTAHLLRSNLDTLCGASSSTPDVWSSRRVGRKPPCGECAAILDAYDRRNGRLRRAIIGEGQTR